MNVQQHEDLLREIPASRSAKGGKRWFSVFREANDGLASSGSRVTVQRIQGGEGWFIVFIFG
ncbi:unnamed protein product [Ilex paraguariensis]|uniref:Uncharacterized protein n=1 Tax=Ilex paraguariensis TaxID=185542 RepID=A0ABC8QQX6_9AQUA